MNNSNIFLNYKEKNIDHLINSLNPPNILDAGKLSLGFLLLNIIKKISVLAKRIKYKFINGEDWYDEKKAKNLIKCYINHPEFHEAFKSQHKKMLEIFNRLAHLSNGNGTWADGIDKEFFFEKKILETFHNEPENEIEDLAEMLKGNVIIPDAPEETIFTTVNESVIQKEDSRSPSYVFIPIKNFAAPSNKQLFHIQADEFGNGSKLEGHQSQFAVNYLHDYLAAANLRKDENILNYPSELIDQLAHVVKLDTDSTRTQDIIHNTNACVYQAWQKICETFNTAKPLLLMGGWTAKPSGHAVYYEIIPVANNKVTFRIYNTGAGINHHYHHRDGFKTKYQTYAEWNGIDRTKFESPHFLEALYELNTHPVIPGQFEDTEFEEKDIYLSLKNYLQPEFEKSLSNFKFDENLMNSPQRAGVCSWKSLMAFVRTKMEINDYKRFKCDIKLQSLKDFVEANPHHFNVIDWRLVKKSHQNLCQAIIQLHQKKLIGDKYLQSAQEELDLISQWIHKYSACRFRKQPAAPLRYNGIKFNTIENKHILPIPLIKTKQSAQNDSLSTQPWKNDLLNLSKLEFKDPKHVGENLKKVNELSKEAWLNRQDLALYKGIINTVTGLELDIEYWKEAIHKDPHKAEELIIQLGKMANLFMKSCFMIPNAQIIFSEKVYIFHKILYLQEMFCRLGHPTSVWKNIDLDATNLEKYKTSSLFLSFTGAKMHREMIMMKNSKVSSSIKLNTYRSHTSKLENQKDGALFFEFRKDQGNSSLDFVADFVRTEFPEVMKKISQKVPFDQLPAYTQTAHIYASPYLPEWIKAMRDTQLLTKYLKHSFIDRLDSLNRDKDIKPIFDFKDEGEKTTVIIKLKGVKKDILQNSQVQEIKDNPYLRFGRQFPKITSKFINDFIAWHQKFEFPTNEKALIYQAHKVNNVDKELTRLFLNPSLQITETLEYFTKHPQKLKESDYQTLFQVLIFNMESLDKQLQIEGFSERLSLFIKNNFERFSEKNEIPTALFFLKMAHYLKGFCPAEEFYNSSIFHLTTLLKRPGIEINEKGLIYTELLAQLAHKKILNDDEILILLVGGIYVEESQNSNPFSQDPYARKEMQEALLIHAEHIKACLSKGNPNQNLLNEILKQLRPNIQSEQEWIIQAKEGEFPIFSTVDGEHSLYPLLSRLISRKTETPLPYNIRQNPHFCQLFPNISQGTFHVGNIYSFEDDNGCETLVYLKDDQIIIEQKLESGDKGWYRYVPSSYFLKVKPEITSLIGSRYLVHHYHHWQALHTHEDGSTFLYAVDKKTQERCYRFKTDSIRNHNGLSCFEIDQIIDMKNGLKLGTTCDAVTSFEDAAYIHQWYDHNNQLKKIELPRFNLSFIPSLQNPRNLICEQFPGYVLNNSYPVRELGSYSHYILLQNVAGQSIVLIPKQRYIGPSEKEVLLPKFNIDRNLELDTLNSQKYIVFNHQTGKLVSKSREANLYLVEILALSQEYNKAASYLKKFGHKLSPYTSEEVATLKNISNIGEVTGDKSGNGVMLQLYAEYLRIKNSLSHHQILNLQDKNSLGARYDLYLKHYRHITIFKLQAAEEIFILKSLLSHSFDAGYFLRLKELDPVAAKNIKIPIAPIKEVQKPKKKTIDGFSIPYLDSNSSEKPKDHILLTRPKEALKEHFLYFYEIARKGCEEEKQRLQHSLHFLLTQKDSMANFFEAVLNNPNVFPEPIELDDYDYYRKEKWSNSVLKIASNELAKNDSLVFEKVDFYGGDVTHKSFHLDEKKLPLRPLDVQTELPRIASFNKGCKTAKCFIKQKTTKDKTRNIGKLTKLLESFETEDKALNPSIISDPKRKEIFRLVEDLKQYQIHSSPLTYTCTKEGINSIKAILAKDKSKDKEQLVKLEKMLLTLANKEPKTPEALAKLKLQKWGKLRKVITLEELMLNFAQNDYSSLLQKNPLLTDADIHKIAKSVGSYLLHATRDQKRTRAEADLEKLEALNSTETSEEYNELANKIANELLMARQFNPLERPAYLVFEYFDNISIRPAQIAKLEKFLKEKDLNLVMEMIMGSGKSKVLLPLLGMMKADGKTLSMLIVPQPLFESISQDTQERLQGAFSQSLRTLHFDRDTHFTKETLDGILDDLKNIKSNKECLIMTGKSVKCLILKFIGECSQHFNSHKIEFSEELKLMQQILNLLGESGYPIIDEADTVLNVLHEVSFSGGNRLSPLTQEIELLSELYNLIYRDPNLKKLARVESDPNGNKEAPLLTEEEYVKTLQFPLANAFVDRLKVMTFESKYLTHKMHHYISNLKNAERKKLLHYLCQDKKHIKTAQSYFDSLDEDLQDIFALAGEEISHLLPYTLTRICDVKYGWDDKSGASLAIPFSAANTPSSGSQFSNPYITMNYTFQTYMRKGMTFEMVENQIKLLQEKAMREIAIHAGKMEIKDTEAGKAFARLKGNLDIPLFNYKRENIYPLVSNLNANAENKLAFVSNIILPQLELFENKNSCNPQNLVQFFNKISGFTGTLWNGFSMHHKLNPEPEVGTDAKTLALLWKNSLSNAVSIKEGSSKEMMDQIKNQSIPFDMISDAGGYFKDSSNRDIAHELAGMYKKETVYYDKSGEQTISDISGDMPLAQTNKTPEERLTFLDQSHTTGADVPQKRDAISLVTVGQNMLLRDLLQAVWRLRGLDKSQKVRFLINEEVAGLIRQKLKLPINKPIQLEAILKFTLLNQASQQGKDNYKALKQEFSNIPQQILLSVLMNEKLLPEARVQAYKLLKSTWIKPAIFRAKDLYGQLPTDLESPKILEMDKKQCKESIKDIFTKLPWLAQIGLNEEDYLKEVDNIANRIKDALPTHLQTPSKNTDNDQTVEIEKETQTETEKQTELEIQVSNKDAHHVLPFVNPEKLKEFSSFEKAKNGLKKSGAYQTPSYDLINQPYCPCFSLKSYLKTDTILKSYESAFEGIDLTLNVLSWSFNQDDYAFLGPNRIDFHHLLVKDSKVTLLSQEEAAHYHNSQDYYNLTLGFNNIHKSISKEQLLKIVKIKFLNGESQYSPEEIDLLKMWFKVQGAQKMQKLFLEQIIAGYPNKMSRYQESSLKYLFSKNMEEINSP